MIKVGYTNEFIVQKKLDTGFELKELASDETIKLHQSKAKGMLSVGDKIDAFIYLDTEQKPVATMSIPVAQAHEYALMKVIDVQDFGAFVDWGVEKDLLIPGSEQKVRMNLGEYHIVRVCIEDETHRLFGTTKLGKFIENTDFKIAEGDKVAVVPVLEFELGYRCLISKKYIGMIYYNEIYNKINIGEEYQAVIKKIRVDGLVDLSLQTLGVRNLFESRDKVLEILKECGGETIISDKSPPAAIKAMFGMSKKTFKSAVGILYKEKRIDITEAGIKILKKK